MFFLTLIYSIIVNFRNFLYDKKILKIKKIEDIEIICVGNISVGGTGKTPAVQYFAKKLINEGKKIAIVSRGYGGKRKKEPLLVRDYEKICVLASESGDEAYLHSLNLDIPIIVGADRYEACKFAKENFELDCIILDDGFQHRKLYRDKNIILIDSTNPFGGRKLLPSGRLRENLRELKRADEFIITKTDLVSNDKILGIENELKKYNKKISKSIHGAVYLMNIINKKEEKLNFINNKKVLLVSGIANPENFEKTVKKYLPYELNRLDFKDHYDLKKEDYEKIFKIKEEKKSEILIITEKDYVKFKKEFYKDYVYILKIEFQILEESDV